MTREDFEKYLREGVKDFKLNHVTPWLPKGVVVNFKDDDGSDAPLFYSEDLKGNYWVELANLEPVFPQLRTTTPFDPPVTGVFPRSTFGSTFASDGTSPTEDLRKLGKWSETILVETVDGEEHKIYMNTCSLCGKSEMNLSGKFNYCPWCGAKMEK